MEILGYLRKNYFSWVAEIDSSGVSLGIRVVKP